MVTKAEFNRSLGLKINREIWNEGKVDLIPQYFSENFVSDRGPRSSLTMNMWFFILRSGADTPDHGVQSQQRARTSRWTRSSS